MTPDASSTHGRHLTRRGALRALGGALGAASAAACSASSTASGSNNGGGTSARLSALTLSAGTLAPAFAADVLAYSVTVGYAVDSVTVTAIAADAAALNVNGQAVASGAASSAIPVAVGATPITIAVTSADATVTTYTVTVARASSSCVLIPEETVGPYPLASLLSDPDVVRADIREGKAGVPLTLVLGPDRE